MLLQLCRFPGSSADTYIALAGGDAMLAALTDCPDAETRMVGHKIKNIVDTCRVVAPEDVDLHPGGRHDNDHADYRQIAILPTADEVKSTEPPFLRRYQSQAESEEAKAVSHCLDGHFRLLREDMLYEMKDELQIAFGQKKGRHRGLVTEGYTIVNDVFRGTDERLAPWGIVLKANYDFWFLNKVKDRRKFFEEKKNYFKHQAYTCLLVDDEVVAFPMIHRDEARLALKPPVVVLQFPDGRSTIKALLKLRARKQPKIKIIQIDTAIFSYEPVLKVLQDMRALPLARELLCWSPAKTLEPPTYHGTPALVQTVQTDPHQDLGVLLRLGKSVVLDPSQASSLIAGLTQRVSLIQGPPGTGKSFIGALLTRIQEQVGRKILVVCYTNHALDQFLEDILDMGVREQKIVRLGGKSTSRTEPLSLQARGRQETGFRLTRADHTTVDLLKADARSLARRLDTNYSRFVTKSTNILSYLEFADEDAAIFCDALTVPESQDGMAQVGKGGKAIDRFYLLNRWEAGSDAGVFQSHPDIVAAAAIWQMDKPARQRKAAEWRNAIRKEQAEEIVELGSAFNDCQLQIERTFRQRDISILRSKQIIGCTTTGAAKYASDLRAARPDVLIVEEAGEILESHVITSLGEDVKQVILIGDHKQLRPKVNNYALTIEKDDGYELNRSMFERLVREEYPHTTLLTQHRMRPEISALIRSLTYPELIDAPTTQNRPNLRGVRDNLVFINHDMPEDDEERMQNQAEWGSRSSKRNKHEASMVLKIVKYLGQQGYGTDKIVVLTPYLGQLSELQTVLKADNDPWLADLDSFDLRRAGLIPDASAQVLKGKLRIATIDNYQGEESDIIISCLTRSNSSHDIGFMFAPERLNVLLSRPRNAFIMIGNSDTFLKSRKGHELWGRFFDLMKAGAHIYDGLPVKCERHPDRTADLKMPEDFDVESPDGGCKEPCGTILNCGQHACPSKCHQLADHSKMKCERVLTSKCDKGHPQKWKCSDGPPLVCVKCEREAKLAEERLKRDLELEQKREAKQRAYAAKLAAIDEEIAAKKQELQDAQLEVQQARTLEQRAQDRDALIERLERGLNSIGSPIFPTQAANPVHPSSSPASAPSVPALAPAVADGPASPSSLPSAPKAFSIPVSPARLEWQRQKDVEGASEPSIDSIMEMIGLEGVKQQLLDIKATIDMTLRQGTSLKKERFNTTFLGNPGTGKTTVARHYANFLTSVGVIPGSEFVETTGARLCNEGVPGTKKMLETVLNAGGGVIFVDEAYQLTSDYGGRQVLEFLLAEMENNVGTLVFFFAGYSKEMEKFMEQNPGLLSRVPHTFKFADYTDPELLGIFAQLVKDRYDGQARIEDGLDGLNARILVRRVGRGRGRPGFGNARAVANVVGRIRTRQASRLHAARVQGTNPDEPSTIAQESKAWIELQKLVGLDSVKESVQSLMSTIERNYMRELKELEPIEMSLNQVFYGNPGTGKTTVANLYGQILADLGMISKGEVVLKNPSDFIGDALGVSESKTKQILASSVGKVLVIDEAYMLYNGSGRSGGGNQNDPYKTAVIDTIVAEVQSVPGDDRCVLLLGYEDKMIEMFQNVNPGLSRRFNIESAFLFEDFTDAQLLQVLEYKLKKQHLDASPAAKQVAIDVLSRARVRPNFGNAGEVENILGTAKKRFQARQGKVPKAQRTSDVILLEHDFDPDFDRNANASTNISKLFEDVLGCDEIVKKLARIQMMAATAKRRGSDVRSLIPTNWIFKGPPGTGKTTVARKMGQVYYDMGFLSSVKVLEQSATDLIGEHVGQTGPKTAKLLDTALGKVLFIDEAYRLREGPFAKEAIDELVGLLTQPKYMAKLIVILAGYTEDINALLAVNGGLASRFSEELVFPNMSSENCINVLKMDLAKHAVELDGVVAADMIPFIDRMAQTSGWGNARDMKTIARSMITNAFQPGQVDSATLQRCSETAALAGVTVHGLQLQAHDLLPLGARIGCLGAYISHA